MTRPLITKRASQINAARVQNAPPPEPRKPCGCAEQAEPIQIRRIMLDPGRGRKFHAWLRSWARSRWLPTFTRLVSWISAFVWKVPEYRRIINGPRRSAESRAINLAICEDCPECVKHVVQLGRDGRGGKQYRVDMFCGACNCGTAPRAELGAKLWYLYHECPRGLHPDGWGQYLESPDETSDPVSDDDPTVDVADIREEQAANVEG